MKRNWSTPHLQAPAGLIQDPEFNTRLVKRFGLRERVSAPTLAPEIQPVVLVDDVFNVPDYAATQRRRCAGSASFATTVSELGFVELFNPATSSVLVLPRRVSLADGLGSQAIYDLRIVTGQITLGPGGSRSGETELFANRQIPGVPQAQLARGNADDFGGTLRIATVATDSAGSTLWVDLMGYVIVPNSSFLVQAQNSVIRTMHVSLEWDEVERPR